MLHTASRSRTGKRYTQRPSGAFRLLVYILYGQWHSLERMSRGYVRLHSISKFSRKLGTESKRVNDWIHWLETQGYLQDVLYAPNRRSVQFRVRTISQIHSP